MKKLIPEILAFLLIFAGCTGADSTAENIHGSTFSAAAGDDPGNIAEPVEAAAESPFKGLPVEETDMSFSPLVNKKSFDNQLFCYDGRGNIYFANPADNLYLYVYDGEDCRAAAEMPVCGLGYDGGYVYFLSGKAVNIEDDIGPSGYPYRYDPRTGETKKLGEAQTESLTVIDGELYGLNFEADCYAYKYDSGERLFNSFYIQKTGDYFLTCRPEGNGIAFYLENGDISHLFITEDIPRNPVFSYGKCFYIDQNTHELKSVNLTDGSVNVYCSGGIGDFTLMGGDLYIIDSDQFLCRYDEGKLSRLNDVRQFESLYSDDGHLYGIGKEYSAASGRMEYFFVKLGDDFSAEIISRRE